MYFEKICCKKICTIVCIFFAVFCLILYSTNPYYQLSNDYDVHVKDLKKLQRINEVQPSLVLKLVPDLDYYFSNKSDESAINIIAAYYDPRVKKIIIMFNKYYVNAVNLFPYLYKFYCQLFYNKINKPINSELVIGNVPYPFLYCTLPKNVTEIPPYVSLSKSRENDTFSTNQIPVLNLQEVKNTVIPKRLAMCVGILFEYQNWLMLIQYIEFHRLQGVDKFIFFYSSLHSTTRKILDWYLQNTEIIEMVHWNFSSSFCPYPYSCQYQRDMHCLYSLMYRYKYVGFSDIDELYSPVGKTLMEFLNEVDTSGRGSFTFSVKYQLIEINDAPEWSTIDLNNVSLIINNFIPLYHFKTMLKPYALFSPKTMYKPETVFAFLAHIVYEHVKGSTRYDVEYHQGFLRHFKIKSDWKKWIPPTINDTNIVDPIIEIGEELLRNVTKNVIDVVKLLNGWNS